MIPTIPISEMLPNRRPSGSKPFTRIGMPKANQS